MMFASIGGCRERANEPVASTPSPPTDVQTASTQRSKEWHERVDREVKAFCADCHVLPLATSSERDHWPGEVDQG